MDECVGCRLDKVEDFEATFHVCTRTIRQKEQSVRRKVYWDRAHHRICRRINDCDETEQRSRSHIETGAVGSYIYYPKEAGDSIDDRIGVGVDN